MIRVYVAGKYSDDNVMDVLNNIRKGIQVCTELFSMGFAPFCPWYDAHFVFTMNHDQYSRVTKQMFYDYTLSWLAVSDCVFLLPERTENSDGVQRELELARELYIPIFTNIDDLVAWDFASHIDEGNLVPNDELNNPIVARP